MASFINHGTAAANVKYDHDNNSHHISDTQKCGVKRYHDDICDFINGVTKTVLITSASSEAKSSHEVYPVGLIKRE